MASSINPRTIQVTQIIPVMVLLGLLFKGADCSKHAKAVKPFDYPAMNCRKHSALLTDFGAVGDGKTSNTKAFNAAVRHLSRFASDGGAQLVVPPGKWLTGSFNLTSHFTLYLQKDAVILGSQDEEEYPHIPVLPSYGRGRDAPAGRWCSLVFGTNLTDVVITGANGTIDGQGTFWWEKFRKEKLGYTRPYLIEIMYSDQIQISNVTLVNSPSWNVHPIYSSNILVQGVTILAPIDSPNTDGIDPDSCTNVRIEDCYVVSGDDCIAIKSGWDQYGIAVGMPTKNVVIRRFSCISPFSAVIALGSEMSGGIQNVRIEDITALNSEAVVRIKTAVGRGAYIKNIYARNMNMKTMKYVFRVSGDYSSHPNEAYDRKALPIVKDVSFSDVVAENVNISGKFTGIKNDPFTGFCMSNVKIQLSPVAKKLQWNCSDIQGISRNVTPQPCSLFADQGKGNNKSCPFPTDKLPIEDVKQQMCSYKGTKA